MSFSSSGQIHITFEGVLARRIVCLVNNDVHEGSPANSWWRRVVVKYMLPGMKSPGLIWSFEMTTPSPRLIRAPNGLLIIPADGRVITSEMVKEALEEDDFE